MPVNAVFSSLLQKTLRDHPYMVMLMMLTVGIAMFYSYQVFAERVDVDARFNSMELKFDSMGGRINQLESKVDLRYLETSLHDIEREIYQLERLVESGEANDRDHQRLSDQRIRRDDLIRQIEALS